MAGYLLFYIPVTLFSKTKPKVGLLMIPKTCAYMWLTAIRLTVLYFTEISLTF
ncbi:hypothetical protein GPK69_10665 [Roseburia inulinivorans]|jgi:hypothetical protein|nr:hypothetical protein [Roseburia sp.]MBT9646278.1 hypothetical protein [Roseburia inulinivorans]